MLRLKRESQKQGHMAMKKQAEVRAPTDTAYFFFLRCKYKLDQGERTPCKKMVTTTFWALSYVTERRVDLSGFPQVCD